MKEICHLVTQNTTRSVSSFAEPSRARRFASIRVLVSALAFSALACLSGATATAQNYTFERTITAPLTDPMNPNSGLYNPNDLDIDAFGNMAVADTRNDRVVKFDALGNIVGTISIAFPVTVALDGFGNTFVGAGGGTLRKYDATGTFVWAIQGVPQTGIFSVPSAIALDPAGNLFQADLITNKVSKYDSNGQYLSSFGASGTKNGLFNAPEGIYIDSTGNIYVADTGNMRVQKFDSTGKFLFKFGIASNTGANPGMGEFNAPLGIALDSFGNIVVSDITSSRFQVFTSKGKFISQFGTFGNIYSQTPPANPNAVLFNPAGLSFDASGRLFLADSFNNRIQVFYPAAADFTSSVTITPGTLTYRRATNRYSQTFTVHNTSGVKIRKPLSLVFDNLPANVSVYQPTAMTQYVSPLGSPYKTSAGSLAAGAQHVFTVEFTAPSAASISYATRLLAGQGWR